MKTMRLAVLAAAAALVCPGFAVAGTLQVGNIVAGTPTATNPNPYGVATAKFIDTNTNVLYRFFLEAREQVDGSNSSQVTFNVHGGGLTTCSVHGDPARLNVGEPFNYGGTQPIRGCGTASGQSVFIDGCTAMMQTHGFIHSDNPMVNYWGATTIDVKYEKKKAPNDKIQITLHTPTGKINLSGEVVSQGGVFTMPSCQN